MSEPQDNEQTPKMFANNQRVIDMLRFCRSELHEAELITNDEYAEIVQLGSASARRLEDYDELRTRLAAAESELVEWREYGEVTTGVFGSMRETYKTALAENERLRVLADGLAKALEQIEQTRFGWDGDCGVSSIATNALTAYRAQPWPLVPSRPEARQESA